MTLGTPSQPHGILPDNEPFVEHPFDLTRTFIRFIEFMTTAMTLAAGFLAVLFLEVVLDHAFGLPLWLRRVVLTSGVAAVAAFSTLRVVMPLMRGINGTCAAKTIDAADSLIKNRVANDLKLRRSRTQIPRAVMATPDSPVVTGLTQVEVDSIVSQQRMVRAWYALSGVCAIFYLYAIFSLKSVYDSSRRAFLADVARPTKNRFVDITPGSDPWLMEVVAGDQVTFSVRVEGVRPQKVLLHYSVDDGKSFAPRDFTPGKHVYDPWQVTLTNVQKGMDYYLTGGDAESSHYRLRVMTAPTILSIGIDLRFPDYTNIPPRMNVAAGTLEAIEGTVATVHAKTNMAVDVAAIDVANGYAAPMEVAPDDHTVLTGCFRVDKSGTYKVVFRTTGNHLNPNPVSYDIIAIPDRSPTARIVRPGRPSISVPANANVSLVMTGNDDRGVKDATLHVTMGNVKLFSKNLLEGQPPQPEFQVTETLDLARYRLKPGSKLNYWLTVRDNKLPASNRYSTAHQVIEVTDPVSPAR